MLVVPVILSGGAGTRLWPISREGHPKPFMRLPDGQTLLGKTYLRAASLLPDGGSIITVTNREHFFASKDVFNECGFRQHKAHYLLEPEGRNTAPAIAVAARVVAQQYGEDTLMVVMAADHLIQDVDGFCRASNLAFNLAQQGHLVTYGIRPTAPETGFGYIQAGDALADGSFSVMSFVEKPDLQTAQELVDSGRFLWNSGMFCFTAGRILHELQELEPAMAAQAERCVDRSIVQETAGVLMQEFGNQEFTEFSDVSIDYAVMERSRRVAVVPSSFDWSDIGSWTAIANLLQADVQGNRVQGEVLLLETTNTFVLAADRMVATLGVEDLIVVDTTDALLIAKADRAQDVKKIAKQLKASNHDSHRLHRTVSRPWGTYTVLEEGQRFKIKRIVVKPGGCLSLQMHHHRSEHWIVVQGMAKVHNDEQVRLLSSNESTFIAAGHHHRLENPGVIDLVMIEVQSGEYLGEDDIVRFVDNYGRAPA